ncbi:MAG: cyclase family protein [Gemmatimonadetes bacterium]|nr:cyclase family protein [Gemmatimonadota bacterium]
MYTRCRSALSAIVLAALSTQAGAFDVASYRLVDLGHAYGEETLYWPSRPVARFELERLAYGETASGYFYAANRFCAPEHGGTHLDAPIHFARDRRTIDELPLEQLIAPAVRIDVGRSRNFMVHRIAAAANVGGLENLTNLDQLPETGFHVIALPMKTRGGSGGPVRVIALVPR